MSNSVLVREVFRTRYGKADTLIGLMKKNEAIINALFPETLSATQWRYLVDISGEMFHVITEVQMTQDAFVQWSQANSEAFQTVEFQVWFNQMMTCTEAGINELWRVHVPPPTMSGSTGRAVARSVFQARYGKADAVIEHLKKENLLAQKYGTPPLAIYTDMSGPMFTVVGSRDYANLAEWEQVYQHSEAQPEFSEWRKQLLGMVEVGRREFYRIV